jgi:DNA-binding CsgD family transcriptional regulator
MTKTNDEIIQLLGSGYTVKEIANMLGMKTKTVEKRISTMKRRNDCKTVTQLVVNWLKLANENVLPV